MREDVIALAKVRLEELLTFFGINTTVNVVEDGDGVELQVPVDGAGRLIGHHGENLRAIQHLLNAMLRHDNRERLFISVDVAGYKQARAHALAEQAKTAALKVAETGEEYVMRPMSAAERRMVHMALAGASDVETESRGDGRERQVVIRRKG